GLCGREKFELPNFGARLHREPLFISTHVSLTTEAHPVVAIDNQPQMAATVIAAVLHDVGRLGKAWCRLSWPYPRWRYDESSTHAWLLSNEPRALTSLPLTNVDSLTLCLTDKTGQVMSPIPEKFLRYRLAFGSVQLC